MINRIRIKGYKSLRDVVVNLSPFTIIVGPNAVGKSNLFDALGLLSRMVLTDAFNEHRGAPLEAFSVGEGGIRELLKKGSAQFTMEVDVLLSDSVIQKVEQTIKDMRRGIADEEEERQYIRERYLRYSLAVEILTDSGHLRVLDEKLAALKKDGNETESRKPFYEKVGDKIHLRMEGQARPFVYDVGLNYTIASTPVYPPHYPHLAAFREELSRWRYYLEPSAMRKDNDLKEVESLGQSGGDLAAFYNTLDSKNKRQFEAINRTIHQVLPSIEEVKVDKTDQGLLRLSIKENGIPFAARVISEGTLRVLGLLAITKSISPLSVVGYEEPENGVHPRRLKLIADILNAVSEAGEGTQFIVNTHSPILPQYFAPKDILLCKRENLSTVFEPLPIGGLFAQNSIDQALEESSYAERVIRGDFGG
jgi:predicted ATPase